jgi:putative PEP-CTERM system TPR-repeat lipoprotein
VVTALAVLVLAAAGSVSAADAALERARADWQAGRLIPAATALKGLLQRDPSLGEARALLAQVYLDGNDPAAAEQEADRALRQGVARLALLEVRGRALVAEGKFDRVIAELIPDVDQPAELRAEVLALRGDAYLGRDEQQAADEAYTQALEASPTNTRALIGQARRATARGDLAAARQLLTSAGTAGSDPDAAWLALGFLEYRQHRYAEAQAAYTRAAESSAGRWQAYLRRAEARLDGGDPQGAQADVALARELFPASAELDYLEGLIAFQAGDYPKAKDLLEAYVHRQPTQGRALYCLGAISYQLGEYQRAEEYLDAYLKSDPQALMAVKVLAAARLARGSNQAAADLLAPRAGPAQQDREVLELQARALIGLDQPAAALEQLRIAARLAGTDVPTAMRLAALMLQAQGPKAAQETLRRTLVAAPDRLEVRLLLIDAYLADGQAAAALREAQEAVAQAPRDPRAAAAQGLAHLAAKQPEAAQAALRKALELQPGFPGAALNLGRLIAAGGDPAGARRLYEQALVAEPGNTQALVLLAQLDTDAGATAAALERLRVGLAAAPANAALRAALARLLILTKDPGAALHLLQEAPSGGNADPNLLLVRGQAELASGQAYTAVATLRDLVAAQPQSAAAHLLLAQAALAAKDTGTMVEHAARGLELEPGRPQALPTALLVLAAVSDPTTKAALVTRLQAVVPDNVELAVAAAQTLGVDGDPEAERRRLVDLHRDFPTNQAAYRALVLAEERMGNLPEATRIIREWLVAHPDEVESMMTLAQFYRQESRPDEERQVYAEVLARQPQHRAALNNLAWLLRRSDPATALRYAEQAHALDPQDAVTTDTLGVLLLAKGERARALELLNKANTALPDDASIAFHYASAQAAAGDRGAARGTLRPILQRSFPEQNEAWALFQSLAP